jgi:glycosyltransferase involved in cell wall biosynthesis
MNKKKLKICVVIPAYNEASVLGDVVSRTIKAFNKSPFDTTILVVDDGSKDSSAKVAAKNGAVVVSHILNSGAGSATATGLSYAQQNDFDIACTMDADGQHAPEDVLKGVNELIYKDVNLLIGSRLINTDGMSKVKVLGNRGLSFITFILFGINSTDSQSGLRIFSRRALEELRWRTSGYEFCSEMLWRAKQLGLKIDEYPIQAIYTDYSKSKGQNNWNAINIIKSLLKRRIAELLG